MRFPGLVHFLETAGVLSISRLTLVADGLGEALAPVRASVLWLGEERATVTVTDGPACRGSASDEKISGSVG